MYIVSIRVRIPDHCDLVEVYAAPSREQRWFVASEGYAEIDVPRVELHEMIVLALSVGYRQEVSVEAQAVALAQSNRVS